MKWYQWITFVLDLLFKYGPSLIKIGREVYRKVEEMAEQWSVDKYVTRGERQKMPSDLKKMEFYRRMRPQWERAKGATPAKRDVAKFRQRIWVLENKRQVKHYDEDEVQAILETY